MTEQELQEIEARERAALEGPWQCRQGLSHQDISGRRIEVSYVFAGNPDGKPGKKFVVAQVEWFEQHVAIAEFICHAREDVPRLVAEIRRLRGPFTCSHPAEFAGGACAACHAIVLDKIEELSGQLFGANVEIDNVRKMLADSNGREEQLISLLDELRKTFPTTEEPPHPMCADPEQHPLEKLVDEALDGGSPT